MARRLKRAAAQFVETPASGRNPDIFQLEPDRSRHALLLTPLPPLAGRGADLGCGPGALRRRRSPRRRFRISIADRHRSPRLEAARRNIKDARARFHWADARRGPDLKDLDFVVMNPPFHDGGPPRTRALARRSSQRRENRCARAARLWLTANRHLPLRGRVGPLFRRIAPQVETGGYKIYEAR